MRLDRGQVVAAGDCPGDAGGPELDVAPRALLERASADDVGDRQPPARPQHPRRLGEDPMLGPREVDDAVGEDSVEARVLERKLLDVGLDDLDLAEPISVAKPRGLVDLFVGDVHPDDAA